MAVSNRLRFEVFRRDGFACRYCGRKAPDVELTVDHVVPQALGGSDDPTNLVSACADCNSGKTSTSPDEPIVADVAEDALRWRRAIEMAHKLADDERAVRAAFCEVFLREWKLWSWKGGRGEIRYTDLPGNWDLKVGELHDAGLAEADMREAITTAMSTKHARDEFAYFVGVARTRIANRQAVAKELILRGVVS